MSSRGRVIFLHSGTDLYGAAKILVYVVDIFRRKGYEIIVIMPGEGPLKSALDEQGIETRITNLGILRRKHFHPLGISNRIKRLFASYRFLNKIHQERKIDLIYSNTLAVIVGALFAERKSIPHCWHIHEIIQSPLFLVRFLARRIDSSTPQPIMVSEAVARHWQKFLKKSKPMVIHNGIDYTDYLSPQINSRQLLQLPEDKTIITMVGRINPGKGQLFFLEMAKKLVQKHKDIHFLMIGDPYPGYEEILKDITNFISKNNLGSKVSYLGFRNDIPDLLRSSNIFVLPSILPDSFPTVILEAMATGIPVVATRSGGAEEMLTDGETGFLIPIGDTNMAVDHISTLISQPDLVQKMGEKGREKVISLYSFEKFTQNIEEFLCQILPKKKSLK